MIISNLEDIYLRSIETKKSISEIVDRYQFVSAFLMTETSYVMNLDIDTLKEFIIEYPNHALAQSNTIEIIFTRFFSIDRAQLNLNKLFEFMNKIIDCVEKYELYNQFKTIHKVFNSLLLGSNTELALFKSFYLEYIYSSLNKESTHLYIKNYIRYAQLDNIDFLNKDPENDLKILNIMNKHYRYLLGIKTPLKEEEIFNIYQSSQMLNIKLSTAFKQKGENVEDLKNLEFNIDTP